MRESTADVVSTCIQTLGAGVFECGDRTRYNNVTLQIKFRKKRPATISRAYFPQLDGAGGSENDRCGVLLPVKPIRVRIPFTARGNCLLAKYHPVYG